jgi:serine/threonine protein kinase
VSGEYRPAVGDFPVGARIAGYQIQELLGRGGMAVVYRAADVRLDRQVALKVLAPELTKDSGFRQRFIRESRAGASVDHPNIIPVFEAGEAEGVLFIAMRFVAGRDVRALLDAGPLPPARAVSIVTQIASALDTAHARGLVHRDVKPANMLLGTVGSDTTPDHVYLSDFGLSKISASAVSLTGTGQFLGTIDYMSPEQVEGRQIDGRTDQYALACATFEMLTGRPPFQRDQDLAVMWAQVSAAPPSAIELRPELPAAVDPVIAKALAKAPEHRHASCLEFAAALRDACALSTGRAQAGQPPPTELAAAVSSGQEPGGQPEWGTPRVAAITPPVPAQATASEATITEAAQGAGAGGAAARQARAGPPRVTAGDQGFGPTGPVSAPWQPQAPHQGPPRRGRGTVVPVLVGLLTVAVLAGAAVLVLHLRGSGGSPQHGRSSSPSGPAGSSSQTGSSSSTPVAPTTPRAVVTTYYRDINLRHYQAAYQLNPSIHATQSFLAFKSGYGDTRRDYVTITGISGNVVSLNLTAQHTDGTLHYFSGTLTVSHGKIVASNIS